MSKTMITTAILMGAFAAVPVLAQEATTTTTTTATSAAASFPGANGAQIKAGDTIYDPAGNVVGTVQAVDANGATVSTGTVTVGLPLSGIGPAPKGLVIALTREQVEAQAKANTPSG